MFRDDFTNFIFNDIDSKTMKVWITNSRDLQEALVPASRDNFITQSGVDGRIYTGTTIESSTITVKCAAVEITDRERRNISQWLNAKAYGPLIFGFDKHHYYEVKVSGEIIADRWIRGRYHKELGGYTYIYNFTVKFTTVNDWAKLGVPVNVNVSILSEQTQPFNTTSSVEEITYNEFSNLFNAYCVPFLAYSSRAVVHQNTSSVEYSNTTPYNSIYDLFNLRARSGADTTLYTDYVYQTSGNLTTHSLITICNPGLEDMYIAYTHDYEADYSPRVSATKTYNYSLSLNGENWYNFDIGTENTLLPISFDSYVGSLTTNGNFIPLYQGEPSIALQTASYYNGGQASIPSGNPELITLDEPLKCFSKNNLTYIVFKKNYFSFPHHGYCHFSLFDSLPQSNHEYSINGTYSMTVQSNNLIRGTGYICSIDDFSTFADGSNFYDDEIISKDDLEKAHSILIINSNTENIPSELIYKYFSICDAHVLKITNHNILATSRDDEIEKIDDIDDIQFYDIFSLQTRGN